MENREIPKGWRETTLGEVAEIVMGQSPKGESYNTDGDGIPFYQGVTEFNDKYVAIKTFTNQPTKVVEPNTILFSVRAPVGRVNFTKHKSCIGRGNAGFTIKNGSQEFLYYLLINIENYIQSHSSGTVFSSISGKELKEIKVTVPSIYEEQVAIGQVLSSLDEKIELLEEENKTLETLAQIIFTEWFVNFNYPDATGEMVNSEMGEIPKGWRVETLDDVLELIIDYRGKTPKKLKMDWSETGIPALSAKSIKNGKLVRQDAMNFGSEKLYKIWMKDELKKGDVLLTSEAPLGEMYYLADNTKYILSQRVFALRSNEKISSEYLYFYLFSSLGQSLLNARASGSTVQGIKQSELRKISVIVPSSSILENITPIFNELLQKININTKQIETLKSTRDTLLPKLTTGEIRVEGFGE